MLVKSPPYVRYLISIRFIFVRKAFCNIAENTMLNSVEARTPPCLTPLVTRLCQVDESYVQLLVLFHTFFGVSEQE
jgi:hypothetical protein